MDNRKETAEKIITALTNRSGFNDLWYNLDEEVKTEITDEIVNILPIHDVMLGLEGRELFPDQIERAKRFFNMLGKEIDEA